ALGRCLNIGIFGHLRRVNVFVPISPLAVLTPPPGASEVEESERGRERRRSLVATAYAVILHRQVAARSRHLTHIPRYLTPAEFSALLITLVFPAFRRMQNVEAARAFSLASPRGARKRACSGVDLASPSTQPLGMCWRGW